MQDTAAALTVLVGVDFGLPHFDGELEELGLLALSAGLQPIARITCKRKAPDAALFVGTGKADEIKLLAQQMGATEVLFDQALSPAQQRNLERTLELPVNDRIFLILQIFAQRARSHEGKLQVELAKLQYLSTRLVRRWSHLERQSGGIGMRGGPGEKQIELDKRIISDSIKRTKERLEKVKKQRNTQRRQRDKRQLYLGNADGGAGRSVSLSDTVGFIRNLPHGLVDAFKATLQEAIDADLLIHVVDAANQNFPEQIAEVQRVLKEIGADSVPQLLVFNKLDALEKEQEPLQLEDVYEVDGQNTPRLFVSAKDGRGLPALRQFLAHTVQAALGDPNKQEFDPRFDSDVNPLFKTDNGDNMD